MFNQKILCVGNETSDTDRQVSLLAKSCNTVNNGLINDPLFIARNYGFYHTSVVDLSEGQIESLSSNFDKLIWIDQLQDSYPHWKSFISVFRLWKVLEEKKLNVEYPDNKDVRRLQYWWNYLKTNKSFCFHPFAALIPQTDKTTICSKSMFPIKLPLEIKDWKTDPDYGLLRDAMLEGKKIYAHCFDCYDKESRGVESTRQFETLEWASRLKFDSPNDFSRLEGPAFYEIRPSNKCNIMCRMCDDARSHLIEEERVELNLPLMDWKFQDFPLEEINFETVRRVYVAGGEPTIMPEFYNFLQKCIDKKKTDFELCIGTNGMKFSNKLLDLLSHFSDVLFSVSFDGYGTVNDYIRWRSDFDTICKNAKLAQSQGHKIGLQTVPSIYNVTRLHEIFEFYDQEFPGSSCLMQAAEGHNGIFLPWNNPRPDLVVSSMERCRNTNVYFSNGRNVKSYIDQLHELYSSPSYKCNTQLLKDFFAFNDLLDKSRGSYLGNYIPELEDAKKLIK